MRTLWYKIEVINNKFCVSWNEQKNDFLKEKRGVSFEDVTTAIEGGNLLGLIKHPLEKKYPDQMMFVVNIENYVYAVPFVENDDEIFLKTIYPSRKLKKDFLGK